MADPDRIYLQPECCASPETGQVWCDVDAPVDCDDGVPWTEYVRADVVDELAEEVRALRDEGSRMRHVISFVIDRLEKAQNVARIAGVPLVSRADVDWSTRRLQALLPEQEGQK